MLSRLLPYVLLLLISLRPGPLRAQSNPAPAPVPPLRLVTHLARVAPPPGGLVPFRRGLLWGYADTTGRVVVPPVLRAAPPFSPAGFARVDAYYDPSAEQSDNLHFRDDYKPGSQPQRRLFVNAHGEFLLAQPGQAALLQPDGSLRLAARYAGSAGQTELLDVSPEVGVVERLSRDAPAEQLITRRIDPPRLERRRATGEIYPLNDDQPDRYTYVERKRVYGNVRVFQRCSFFIEKRWHVVRSKEALLDGRGHRLTPHRYSEISWFGHGLARVWVEDTDKEPGGYGLIDRRGREVLPPRYQHVSYPNQAGILVVEAPREAQPAAPRRYGLLDTLGRWVVPLQAEVLSDPDAAGLVRRRRLRAPADTVVEFLTLRGQPAFAADLGLREATGFWAGRAWARTAAGTGLLDARGQWVVPPGRYQELRPMHVDGLYWPLATQDDPEFAPHRPDDIRLEGDTAPDYPLADTAYWLVRRAGLYGLVSLATGAEVVPCRYDAITCWVGEYGSGTRNHQDYFLTSRGGRELATGRYRGEWYALPGRGPLFQLHLSPYRWLVCDTAGRPVTALLPQVPAEHGLLLPDNLVLIRRPIDPQNPTEAQWYGFGSAVADTAGHLLLPFRRALAYVGKPSWLNSAYYWSSSSVRSVVPRHVAFEVNEADGQHLLLARAGKLRDVTGHGYGGLEPLAGGWYLTSRAGRSVLLSPEGAEVLAPDGYKWDETLHQVGRVVPFANGTASVAESSFRKPVVFGYKGGLVTRGGRRLWQDETATR